MASGSLAKSEPKIALHRRSQAWQQAPIEVRCRCALADGCDTRFKCIDIALGPAGLDGDLACTGQQRNHQGDPNGFDDTFQGDPGDGDGVVGTGGIPKDQHAADRQARADIQSDALRLVQQQAVALLNQTRMQTRPYPLTSHCCLAKRNSGRPSARSSHLMRKPSAKGRAWRPARSAGCMSRADDLKALPGAVSIDLRGAQNHPKSWSVIICYSDFSGHCKYMSAL